MTPFAQLTDLSKEASVGSGIARFFRRAQPWVRDGIWKNVAQRTAATDTGLKGIAGRASRLFHNPVTDKSTLLSKGLNTYGWGGLGASMLGYNVPGYNLAMNTTMPVLGSLFSAAPLTTTLRASTDRNKARAEADVMTGARSAAGDMLTLAQQSPDYATRQGLYSQYLQQSNPAIGKLMAGYRNHSIKPLSTWNSLTSAFMEPDKLINNHMDMAIMGGMNKGASIPSAIGKGLGTAWRGAGHAFPWLFPTMAVGGVASAALSDKPYNEQEAMTRGYAGAATSIQDKLNGMSGFERFMVNRDPTLIAQQLEAKLPGTIGQWQQTNGMAFQPGFLSRLTGRLPEAFKPNPIKDTKYFQTDAAGVAHYTD